MTDIVWSLRNDVPCNGDIGCACELCYQAADEITRLRAENEKLRAAIETAIRQHEEGNKGLSHRTLCEAIYGGQA